MVYKLDAEGNETNNGGGTLDFDDADAGTDPVVSG